MLENNSQPLAENTADSNQLPIVKLKRREDKRIKAGHLWVFSNEIDTQTVKLSEFTPGQLVSVQASTGEVLGTGYINPHSLITIRLLNYFHGNDISVLLQQRLQKALALRTMLYSQPFYRLVYSEADRLPGLIIDRYNQILVAQITTAGMERLKSEIIDVIKQVINPAALVLRNDSKIRQLEGLDLYTETVFGVVPEQLKVIEQGVTFNIEPITGQKTGYYYDQFTNRQLLTYFAKDKNVLDLFSYVGSWGLISAKLGANQVTCVDSSQWAVDQINVNAKQNDLASQVNAQKMDVNGFLRTAIDSGKKYDLVVLDPPALIKRKKDIKSGLLAYKRLNRMALNVLNENGILFTCSCSYHLSDHLLQQAILKAARSSACQIQILHYLQQGPDHPVHPAINETRYLKGLVIRKLEST